MKIPETIATLRERFGVAPGDVVEFRGETTVTVDAAKIVDICRFLKVEAHFDVLTDLSGADHYGEEPRFEVAYELYSMRNAHHLRVKVRLPEADPAVDSMTTVWKAANWHEREAWDMYGIRFRGHPNLKRILMWEGYPFHPLRKEFPVSGMTADLPDYGRDAGQAIAAPMLGGPFVGTSGTNETVRREPRQYDTMAERSDKLDEDDPSRGAT